MLRKQSDCQDSGSFLRIGRILTTASVVRIVVVDFPIEFLSRVFKWAIVPFSIRIIVGIEVVEIADFLNNFGDYIRSKSVNTSCDDCFRSRDILSMYIV